MLEPGVAWALRSCWEECDDKAGTLASLGGNPHSELRWRCTCMSTCYTSVPRSQPRPSCLRSDGRRTLRWGSPRASCIPGGAPDRREACEHSSEAKAFQDYSAAAAPSPVMGSMAPSDAMASGPMAPGFFQPFMSPRFPGGPRPTLRMPSQPPVGLPGSQPLLPGTMEPSPRAQGHSSMGPMQRVTPPRGMTSIGPQSYGGGGMRPPPNSLAGPGLPTMNMGPGVRGPWASPSGNSIPYSSSSPGSYSGPPGGGGPPGTPIMPSPGDSTNSSENMYTIMNPIGPGAGRANFPLGPGPEGPMAAMSAMEPHHVNGSLGSGDLDGLPKSSPGAVAGLSNTPGTPRDDGEMAAAGTFLHPFPSESVSDCVDSPPAAASGRRGLAGRPRRGGRGARARP
ncbi:single-stranded DNA-binding protein 4 isoform X2 [Budorcas taxicolor]|uniref:single-stranded DNA-binding protein 4 isoform X2 n=1 Tax=Budorcas taxicolor TaxID=37181 RepID=UPI002284FB31|nr:single-stranded DNA-binding protein 4 isoform X2 [Budorcas taxicolor]